jgi:hypothetical protein
MVIGLIGYYFQLPFQDLTANPLSEFNMPFYQGILQRIGLILWGFAVILPLFTYSILVSYDILRETRRFLIFSGFFFGYFLIDELFLIHSFILPKILNIHQLIVLCIYMAITIFFLIGFRKVIIKNFFWIFITAIFFLALSMLIDILSYLKVIKLTYRYLWDDSTKFLGIANIFIYYLFLCRMILIGKIKEFK